jgi:uncharacterized protein YycO
LIPGIMTHAIWYTQYGRSIHAIWHGVGYISIKKICSTYDSFILIRPRWETESQSRLFINYLISKLGKPYDFFFGTWDSIETYFCSELINAIDTASKKWIRYNNWTNHSP